MKFFIYIVMCLGLISCSTVPLKTSFSFERTNLLQHNSGDYYVIKANDYIPASICACKGYKPSHIADYKVIYFLVTHGLSLQLDDVLPEVVPIEIIYIQQNNPINMQLAQKFETPDFVNLEPEQKIRIIEKNESNYRYFDTLIDTLPKDQWQVLR